MRIWHYFIDSDGHLWHEGTEFDDPEFLKFFMQNMEETKDGSFRVLCQGEECRITAEDVPYVITDLKISPRSIELIFPGGYAEPLDPSTFFVGGLNVLYCKVRQGAFVARFSRRSYLEIAKLVKFDSKKKIYFVTIDNNQFPIKGVS